MIELVKESDLINENRLTDLLKDATELTAIFTAIGKTSKRNLNDSGIKKIPNPKSQIPN